MADLMVAGLPGQLAAIGQSAADQPKPFAATMFDGDQEIGIALGEEEEKGRF
jgi:hypothetical protein